VARTICENLCRKSWIRSCQKKERSIRTNAFVLQVRKRKRNHWRISMSTFLRFTKKFHFGLRRVLGRRTTSLQLHKIRGIIKEMRLLHASRNAASLKATQKHARLLSTLMAYASDLLAFPFRSVALLLCVRNLTIDDDVSMYIVASPTSRSVLVFTMPTRPCTTAFSYCSKRWCEIKGKKGYRWEMIKNKKRRYEWREQNEIETISRYERSSRLL